MGQIATKIYRGFVYSINWPKYRLIFKKFSNHTMIPADAYITNLALSKKYSTVAGAIVECGTWKGGMIAGIASLLGNDREYFLFDSFEGLPEAKEIDGESAIKWQSNTDSPNYYDNCTASERDAYEAMEMAGVKNPIISRGWFEESLPKANFEKGIAILRMDADWYDSTFQILSNLFDKVNKGGLIIIDDYYVWDGCSRAVHDYLSINKRTERIKSHRGVCYIVKR